MIYSCSCWNLRRVFQTVSLFFVSIERSESQSESSSAHVTLALIWKLSTFLIASFFLSLTNAFCHELTWRMEKFPQLYSVILSFIISSHPLKFSLEKAKFGFAPASRESVDQILLLRLHNSVLSQVPLNFTPNVQRTTIKTPLSFTYSLTKIEVLTISAVPKRSNNKNLHNWNRKRSSDAQAKQRRMEGTTKLSYIY